MSKVNAAKTYGLVTIKLQKFNSANIATFTAIDCNHWSLTGFIDNILNDDTPTLIQDFPNFDPSVTLSNGAMPTNFILTPRRSRSFGMLLQLRL